jgi:hypothetical protein
MTAARRSLKFATLDDVMPEVDRLLAGCSTVGKWSLGQICQHLTAGVVFSVEGYPEAAPWLIRKTFGPVMIRRILKSGTFPSGFQLPEKYWPKPSEDARAEAEALRAALRLFGMHTGPFAEHPLGAKLSGAEWSLLHTIHAAHHLSFVLPV